MLCIDKMLYIYQMYVLLLLVVVVLLLVAVVSENFEDINPE